MSTINQTHTYLFLSTYKVQSTVLELKCYHFIAKKKKKIAHSFLTEEFLIRPWRMDVDLGYRSEMEE